MYSRTSTAPLTLNTTATANGKSAVFSAATFQYTEDSSSRRQNAADSARTEHSSAHRSRARNRSESQSVGMSNPLVGASSAPPALYVRALYDYDADDRTSLSFRQGDIIQVLTRLETGWWDGIIHGVRGWFPSNYCAIVSAPDDAALRRSQEQPQTNGVETSAGSGTEDDYDEYEAEADVNGTSTRKWLPADASEDHEQEEAAFWIPQATPDGRLFYFNTLTGFSTMELPLEAPTSAHESGPRDRMNIQVPDQTRPPPEMWAGGIEQDEEDYDAADSSSEVDGESWMYASRGGRPKKRRSYISDGVSPAASMDSLDQSPVARTRGDPSELSNSTISLNAAHQPSVAIPSNNATTTGFTSSSLGQMPAAVIPRSFFDDGISTPPTWNKLVENMRRSVEAYRQAINNADRSEYVRKAEDISDHLRMLLAAASSTTDNHSGNPSIISTNKALYPHFRDMMSRFSKLVLSSHIAAADWPGPDSYSKCLQEAEGVLHGVYGFVEVARSQRGEDITRLTPGFLRGSHNGGSWQNNNLGMKDSMSTASFMDQDEYDPYVEPSTRLDSGLLERLDDLKRIIVASIRQLEEHLVVVDKLITPFKHKEIGNIVCGSGGKIIDYFRPWMSTLESIDLSPFNSSVPNPQVHEFQCQKQRLYDLVMHLMLTCQAVAAPLGDEWAEDRGEPLEDRLLGVGKVLRQLETCGSQISFSLQLLLDSVSQETPIQQQHRDAPADNGLRRADVGSTRPASPPPNQARQVRALYAEQAYPEGIDPLHDAYNRKDRSKVEKFFGELPAPMVSGRGSEETPQFLMLDHEGEISYDAKVDPPQLRGGTLAALVEQLTRHDRLDAGFNNTFLLTYRSFTTASELFGMLVKRFSIQPPRGISEDDYKTWVEKKQKLIRFRVVNILKSWFDNYWMETNDQESNELLRRVYSFAKDSIATTQTPGSGPLMTSVEQRLRGQDTNTKVMVPTFNTPVPPPIMPKNMKKLKFLDIDATEFARQLTIIESRLYGKIKPTECLNKTWQRKTAPDEPEPAANVKALILHSNQLTNWVAEMILTQSDVKKRVIVIKHFVAVADVSGERIE
ncbi:MAG: hypothetical protein Q9181_002826 [Wetmoreana brouardii]